MSQNNMQQEYKMMSESEVTVSELMKPANSNFSGKIHGGYILGLMDQIAYASAAKYSNAYCVTASVNRVNFCYPVSVGDLLTLKARINYAGSSSMVIGMRVESENLKTGAINHCNSSYFTMVAVDENGKPTKVPGLILKDQEDVRRFAKSVKRQALTKERDREFSQEDFTIQPYLEQLKDYNVMIDVPLQ